ncbi:MAG TPA: DNA-processing protein DprA [Candidatus Saccharimonadales bacterium]|nr:DNA-processing protein DprA [Candidatus Saccharimonadales bacterium]
MKGSTYSIVPGDVLFPVELNRAQPRVKRLYINSRNWPDLLARPRVAIVGSRKISIYGRGITQAIATQLAKQGVVIVSGLAYGVDICAQKAALEAGGQTIAVLPGSLTNIYPSHHANLAHQMVAQGGALIGEYPEGAVPYPSNFIARNRIVAAISHVVVITEAALKSGTLHTAQFALEQGIDVLAVPGNVTSPTSEGTNNLIKAGAGLVTSASEVLNALGITPAHKTKPTSSNPNEQVILSLLASAPLTGAELIAASGLTPQIYNQTLTMLEINGQVNAVGGDIWQLA